MVEPPPPDRVTIDRMATYRVSLYLQFLPLVSPMPVEYTPFPVEDSIPEEADIAEAFNCLCLNRSGGPPRIRVEHLCQWLREATR